jgi:hypothetical protein
LLLELVALGGTVSVHRGTNAAVGARAAETERVLLLGALLEGIDKIVAVDMVRVNSFKIWTITLRRGRVPSARCALRRGSVASARCARGGNSGRGVGFVDGAVGDATSTFPGRAFAPAGFMTTVVVNTGWFEITVLVGGLGWSFDQGAGLLVDKGSAFLAGERWDESVQEGFHGVVGH